MSSNLIIRDETEEDVVSVSEVFYEGWLVTYPNEEHGITTEDIEFRYKDRLSAERILNAKELIRHKPETLRYIVAELEGAIVGVCVAESTLDHNQLRAIYVRPRFHGRGIGMALWNEAKTFFNPSLKTIVHVVTYNERAISFYKKLGFKDTGKRFSDENYRMQSGNVFPEMEMELVSAMD